MHKLIIIKKYSLITFYLFNPSWHGCVFLYTKARMGRIRPCALFQPLKVVKEIPKNSWNKLNDSKNANVSDILY